MEENEGGVREERNRDGKSVETQAVHIDSYKEETNYKIQKQNYCLITIKLYNE